MTVTNIRSLIFVSSINDNETVGEEWAQFRTTPARIEQETGLHFFTNLNPATAAEFRNRLDQQHLPAPRVITHEH